MRCPNCGEPIETRHSFCVVCGADLQPVLNEAKQRRTAKSGLRRGEKKSALPAEAEPDPPAGAKLPDGFAGHPA